MHAASPGDECSGDHVSSGEFSGSPGDGNESAAHGESGFVAAVSVNEQCAAGHAAVGMTGWMQTWDAYWGAEWLEELHEALAYGLLTLIGVHVLAAIVESLHYRENLIAAMVHGRKRALDDDAQ